MINLSITYLFHLTRVYSALLNICSLINISIEIVIKVGFVLKTCLQDLRFCVFYILLLNCKRRKSIPLFSYHSNVLTDDLIISIHSINCFGVITSGGANRMILVCVCLASSPFSAIFKQMSQARFL